MLTEGDHLGLPEASSNLCDELGFQRIRDPVHDHLQRIL
jgi:hypothetical protein